MDIEILKQAGLTDIQAHIYLYLVRNGQQTPTEIAKGINESRTTVYSAAQRLEKLGVISQKDRGKVTAYIPNHPSCLETLAERRLRKMARQTRDLEGNLPSLINYYNEHQHEPGVATFYGQEGIDFIRSKILSTPDTYYFVRSQYDERSDSNSLEQFKKSRVSAGIQAESIAPSEFTKITTQETPKWLLNRTLLPPNEYSSPIEINIFGDNVAFINYDQNGMSTLIESPEIADAMRQLFRFTKKYITKSTDQTSLDHKS